MTAHQATALLKLLVASYPQAAIEDATQLSYLSHLVEVEAEDGVEAVRRAIATLKFFPSVAELLALAQSAAVRRYLARPQIAHQPSPMDVTECRRVAADLADCAADYASKHGAESWWAVYLAQLAEHYADDGNRIERGEPPKPIPSVSRLVRAMCDGFSMPAEGKTKE